MKKNLVITEQPIDQTRLMIGRRVPSDCGAVVEFFGVVRDQESGKTIAALEYETYREMAEFQFHKIMDETLKRFPVSSLNVIHRIGVIKVGDPSLYVCVIAGHRGEAFDAAKYLIDRLKQVVPIWKKAVP
ncbi:MAG: molybdenum cofactor biosynthesis protein MoaE [Pedosphaera sp.]|nr:molybdenum cofactor biosynthesis protein MoaE [Pedosphaera sp.]